MLSIPLGIQNLIDSGRFSIRYLIQFDLDTGSVGVWNDTFSLTHGGVTFAPLAGNLTFDAIPGSSELDSDRVKVAVSNLASAVTTVIAGEVWHQRPCTISLAVMDDAGNAQHVMTRFAGFLDDIEIVDSDENLATLTMTIESNNRELNRVSGRMRSDSDQRLVLSTDGFFKHAANAAVDSQIFWGRKGPQYPVSTRGKR